MEGENVRLEPFSKCQVGGYLCEGRRGREGEERREGERRGREGRERVDGFINPLSLGNTWRRRGDEKDEDRG